MTFFYNKTDIERGKNNKNGKIELIKKLTNWFYKFTCVFVNNSTKSSKELNSLKLLNLKKFLNAKNLIAIPFLNSLLNFSVR